MFINSIQKIEVMLKLLLWCTSWQSGCMAPLILHSHNRWKKPVTLMAEIRSGIYAEEKNLLTLPDI